MLELIKKLSNTKADDEVINFYIANAEYLNKATMSQGSVENGAIKSISSAGRSVTFMSFDDLNEIGIPQSILARLPKPKVTVKVW